MFKVYIDPGHYGNTYNKSTTGLNYYESAMTWKLAGYLKSELETRNVIVTLSRQTINANPSLYNRGYGAKGYDLFLSLHSNACGTESVDYPIVYRGYDKNEANEFAQKMADLIHKTIGTKQVGKVSTRKGISGEYYGVLRGARAAKLTYYYIIEHSFHTNTAATRWLMSDANLRKLAKAEADLICSYFVKEVISTATRTYLMKGDTGTEVKELQTNLNYLGYKCGTPDGDFGKKTDSAVRKFQKDYKLVVDGKFGIASKKALEDAVVKKKASEKTSSNSKDYSLVFNATYYANAYADLKKAFGYNAEQLLNHFMKYGMKEHRRASANFDPVAYRNRYKDLDAAFGDDWAKYYEHYMRFGYKENRKAV